MSLLRMIKLFAWEKKTEERISEAREDELNWLWKSKALQLSIAIAKCAICTSIGHYLLTDLQLHHSDFYHACDLRHIVSSLSRSK
jgi:hypothetical protein